MAWLSRSFFFKPYPCWRGVHDQGPCCVRPKLPCKTLATWKPADANPESPGNSTSLMNFKTVENMSELPLCLSGRLRAFSNS